MDQRRGCELKLPTCSCQQVVAVKKDDRGDGVLGLKGAILASAALASLKCSNILVRVLQCTCQVCANARKPPEHRPLLRTVSCKCPSIRRLHRLMGVRASAGQYAFRARHIPAYCTGD